MISFLLNDQVVRTDLHPGMVLLDYIRYHRQLTGTKIGCREGDCGACTILSGTLIDGGLQYQSMVSCLMPLANAAGKHIVTVEGINRRAESTPVQQAVIDEAATQCGFCTPGIIMSLTGYCLRADHPGSGGIAAVDGNICRCTGYKSIERAADRVERLMSQQNGVAKIPFLVEAGIVPSYFTQVAQRLAGLPQYSGADSGEEPAIVAGGTDLYVQRHEEMEKASSNYISHSRLKQPVIADGKVFRLDGAATVSDLLESTLFNQYFPDTGALKKLISSTPIRNMATVSGNFVNASPIGDLTIIFLALDAQLIMATGQATRQVALRKFYKAYKTLDLAAGERIQEIIFPIPPPGSFFHFEKVSKRTCLDIATVNTAIMLILHNDGTVAQASIAAGGVGPTPAYLSRTSAYLEGKPLSAAVIDESLALADSEISPISDVRGSATYKRMLLRQLIKAHFINLLPEQVATELMMM